MTKRLWTTIPVGKSTTVEDSNNTFNVTVNDVETILTIDKVGYETRIIQHTSRLVDEISRLFEANSIDIKCRLGVIAKGNIKYAHIVFEYKDTDVVSYSGSFSNSFLGDILLIENDELEEIV